MTYDIGQVLPYNPAAPLFRGDRPRWYALTSAPQSELPASAWLARQGVEEAWYPTREHRVTIKRGQRRVVTRMVPEWPGYVFALCPGSVVSWSALIDRSMHKITGVVMVNGEPAVIAEDKLMDMKDVPNCLKAVRQAQIEAQRIKPGDMVQILDGEMGGWQVTINGVNAGFASFLIPLLGGARAEIEIGRLRKVGI